MSWERKPVAAALAGMLGPLDPSVAVFEAPPPTFGPPAYIVWYPQTVTYDAFAFTVDLVLLPILCVAGLGEWDRVDGLVAAAKKAIDADPQLAGTVAVAKAATNSGWRQLAVAGADYLGADLVLEIRA
jgi:predicted NBD/HSP70 family sugar kinase